MASESAIKDAFYGGDEDSDDTLSVSEAVTALKKLSGKTLDASTVSGAASSAGVDTSREMNFDEFVKVVRQLESDGSL